MSAPALTPEAIKQLRHLVVRGWPVHHCGILALDGPLVPGQDVTWMRVVVASDDDSEGA